MKRASMTNPLIDAATGSTDVLDALDATPRTAGGMEYEPLSGYPGHPAEIPNDWEHGDGPVDPANMPTEEFNRMCDYMRGNVKMCDGYATADSSVNKLMGRITDDGLSMIRMQRGSKLKALAEQQMQFRGITQTAPISQESGDSGDVGDEKNEPEPTQAAKVEKHRPDSDEICDTAQRLYEFVRDTITGDLYAVDRETRIAQPLQSRGEYRQRLSRLAQLEYGRVPKSQSLTESIETLQGMAQESKPVPVHLRIAETNGKVWLDTMDEDNHLILLHDGEWKITDRTEFGAPIFRRSQAMRPLITPARPDNIKASFAKLWLVINVPVEYQTFVLAWMVHAIIHEHSAYPLLYLQAEQGSGKSTAERRIVELVDPSIDVGGSLPTNDEALAIAALSSRVLVYDNLSTIPTTKRDMLCRVSTGGTVRKRQLYTDSGEKIYEIRRPVLLTAINLGTNSPDLTNRMVRAELHRLEQSQRKSDDELKAMWNETKSEIYGALLSIAARVMQTIESGALDGIEKPRMADYGLVLAAIDLQVESHSLDDYKRQQANMAVETVSDEPVYLALQIKAKTDMFRAGWKGKASQLLKLLQPIFDNGDITTWKTPPKSAPDLTRVLDVCAPSLRQSGWTVEKTKGTGNDSGTTVWHLTAPNND